MLKIAVFVSGGGTDLQSIIDAAKAKEIDVDIRLVISNRKNAYGLERARNAGIKAECIKDEDALIFDESDNFFTKIKEWFSKLFQK